MLVQYRATPGRQIGKISSTEVVESPMIQGDTAIIPSRRNLPHDLSSLIIGEPNLSGVTVTATEAGPDGVFDTTDDIVITATTTTGTFSFDDLPSGTYRIDIDSTTLPPGTDIATFDPDGVLDGRTVVTVVADEVTVGVDFGYVGPRNAPPRVLTLTVAGTVGNSLPPLSVVDSEGDAHTVTLVGGSLPNGTTLNPDGTFTGNPTESGTFSTVVEACDARGSCARYDVVVTVSALVSTPLPKSGAQSAALAKWALMALMAGFVLLGMSRRRLYER